MADFIDLRNLNFILYEILEVEKLCDRAVYADHDRQTFDAVLDTSMGIARDYFASHAKKLDEENPSFDGEKVRIIPEVKEAVDKFLEAGLLAPAVSPELGGMGLPWVVSQASFGLFMGANVSTSGYLFLTTGAANLLNACASDEIKERFMRHMYSGRFFGTMCLSEPHAGSSLAGVKTQAVPTNDGHYEITGTKMWISGGDHELAENIVHLVLAKIPGGPAGAKGISLFVVPKYLVLGDGSLGANNNVALAGINHKMGYGGTINTLLNFGENGVSRGYLVGKPHEGLKAMFHMMNEARISVGGGASMLGSAGYLHSLEYAKERVQGNHPDQKDPTLPQIPIIEHPDVKRMLLTQKAYVEGSLLLCLYAAWLVDESISHPQEVRRKDAGKLLGVLTPVCKAWPSAYCLKANELAIQVLGGAGYTKDHPVERWYRENRLNPIHEGANGIQSLDLLGRKILMDGGQGLQFLLDEMRSVIETAKGNESLTTYGLQLEEATQRVLQATTAIGQVAMQGDTRGALTNSAAYLDMLGHVIVGWMWLWQALVAKAALAGAEGVDTDFYEGKMMTCRYVFQWELPKIHHLADRLTEGDTSTLDMQTAWF